MYATSSQEKKVPIREPTSESDSTLNLSPIHEEIWRKAYQQLKQDSKQKKYVEIYEQLIAETFSGEGTEHLASATHGSVSPGEVQLSTVIEKGQEKIKKYKRFIDSSSDIVTAIMPVKAILDIPLKNVPQTSLPWAVISSSIDILIKPTKSMDTLYKGVHITASKIQWYAGIIDRILRENNSERNSLDQVYDEMKNKVIDIYQALLFYQTKSVCSYWRNQLWVFVRSALEFDDWDGDLEEIEKSERALESHISQYKGEQLLDEIQSLREITEKRWKDDDHMKCMQDLCVVNPRTQMDDLEERKDTLIRASYSWALETPEYRNFTDWTNPHASNFLWINGQAGTGKTMLLIGIIRELTVGQLFNDDIPDILYFFLQSKGADVNNATAVVRTLIWLLLSQQPGLIDYVMSEYRRSGKALFGSSSAFSGLSKIFKKMLQDDQVEKVVLVIDALDECQEENDEQKVLLRFLNELLSDNRIVSKLKVLVSSRPEWEIQTEIVKDSSKICILELDRQSLESPINAFIDEKGRELDAKTENKDRLKHVLAQLRLRASNTFIWVSLVCKELFKTRDDYWEKVLDAAPKDLTKLYDFLLFERLKNSIFEDCKKVLALSVLAFRRLTIDEIQQLAEIPDGTASGIVQDCSSFFTVQQGTVYFFHQSAQDYLSSHFEQLAQLPRDQWHHRIFRQSLKSMKRFLKKNVYGLTDLGKIDKPKIMPSDPLASIRYSCHYWAQHLQQSPRDVADTEEVHSFFCDHFLHWLEAMSLLELISDVIESINGLASHFKDKPDSDIFHFLADAKRFVLLNFEIVTVAPLQLYVSCLVFAPTESIVRQKFNDQIPSWITVLPKVADNWNALLQTFETRYGNVQNAAFSTDSSLLTIFSESSIEIRNTDTGNLRDKFYPWERFLCGAVSSDHKLLAWSDRGDWGVTLWNIEYDRFYGNIDLLCVEALEFSPDNRALASIADDKMYSNKVEIETIIP
ncbi:hypothetical protein P170DRAFT_356241 [Aspergillus steynii IBT 23096]|uniref:NACHT domain-containing protein n=1 Tax=Aspergillus steynii IBT 23096 TaxID=1392250 RepID=A0A2I2GDD3_9EURO|nr:uncharacterized protein P170DRAFT_356241 [Aspergillus steynii IBT 23096]PLB50904.1 hypothetical protein P170DRAFT_356241 [Aspergillus steynii IBT 23096]